MIKIDSLLMANAGRQVSRVSSELFANDSKLKMLVDSSMETVLRGLDQEYVHVADYSPWLHVNGAWTGAFSRLINGLLLEFGQKSNHM